MRQNARIIYIAVLAVVALVIVITLLNHPGIEAGVVAGIAAASIVTSLLPFFVSMSLFKKAEPYTHYRLRYKTAGMIVYIFCFPVKIWAFYVLIYLLIHGEPRWAFG